MKKISAAIFSVVMFLSSTMNVSANIQPGEIVDNGNFGIDWSLTNDGTLVLEEGHLEVSDNETYPWSRYSNDIEKITINGEIVLPEQPFLFKGLKHLEAIENIDRINTTNVKDMSYMFYQAESLESLNLSTWDITNVTNMDNMFEISQFDKSRYSKFIAPSNILSIFVTLVMSQVDRFSDSKLSA